MKQLAANVIIIACVLMLTAGARANENTAARNAIFNGGFEHGTTGWKTTGGEAELNILSYPVQDEVTNALQVSLPSGGDAWVYGNQPIKVQPGRRYRIHMRASGNAQAAIGVFEYGEGPQFLRNRTARPVEVGQNAKDMTFVYEPGRDVVEIRPAVRVQPSRRENPVLNIVQMRLDLPAAAFEGAVKWHVDPPRSSTADLLRMFEAKFVDYEGYTQGEMQEMEQAVRVMGVLPPYQPIVKHSAQQFELATSQLTFDGVLPSGIDIRGESILSERLGVFLDVRGNRHRLAGDDTEVDFTEEQVQLVQRLEASGLSVKMQSTLMYDGIVLVTMILTPTNQPVDVDGLELEIPLKRSVARYARYQAYDSERNYGFGAIPEDAEVSEVRYSLLNGRWANRWHPKPTGLAGGVVWEWDNGFLPYFWIGDETKGLGWFAESDEGWHLVGGQPVVRFEHQENTIFIRVSMMHGPVTIDRPRKIQFGIQVTPPKPIRDDWATREMTAIAVDRVAERMADDAESDRYSGTGALAPHMTSYWWTLWSVGCGSPRVADPDAFRKAVQAGRHADHEILPYLTPTHLTLNSPEGYYYGLKTEQWAQHPLRKSVTDRRGPGMSLVKMCVNSFVSEYQAWGIGQLIDEYDIAGIYFDNCGLAACSNTSHGCGYETADGEVRPTLPFMAMRNFFMMVRYQFVKRGRDPLIVCHVGDVPAELSFIDYVVDGEGLYGLDHTEIITLEEMRAMMIGPNQTGVVRVFLPQFTYGHDNVEAIRPEVTRRLMAMTLPHGTKIWPLFCHKGPTQKAQDVFELLDEKRIDFVPYWDIAFDEALPDRILVSLYKQSNRALLVVSNVSRSNQNVKLSSGQLQDLFSAWQGGIRDEMDAMPVQHDGDYVHLAVGERNFRLLVLE